MTYYTYLHARPNAKDISSIFYVGKGYGGRAYELSFRNRYHQAIINKHGAKNILISKLECSSEETALELEKGLIKCLRRAGVTLANLTDGGDGVSGYQHTEEWKKYHSSIMKGKPSPTKGVTMPKEQRTKIAQTLKLVSPWIGRKHSEVDKAKMGKAKGLIWVTNGIYRERAKPSEVDRYLALGFVKGMK